jgi:hypothetical protein
MTTLTKSLRAPLVLLGLLATPLSAADKATPADELGLQLGPDTTVVSGPLDAEGYPDYVAALNERLSAGVGRDENFWVLMWPAIGNAERSGEAFIAGVEQKLGVKISREPQIRDPYFGLNGNTAEFERIDKQYTQAMQRPWTHDEFPEIARSIDANEDFLRQVDAACRRPKTYAPMIASSDARPAMIQILLPHVQAMRSVARLLAARSMLNLGEGNVDAAWQDIITLHRLARHTQRGSTLIECLVGFAIRSIALQPTGHWIAQSGLAPADLDKRWAELAPLARAESLTRSMDSERLMYVDTVIALMSHRTRSRDMVGLLEPAALIASPDSTQESYDSLRSAREMAFQLMFLGSDVNETLRYGNQMYDELVAALEPATHAERAVRLRLIEEKVKKNVAATRDGGALVRAYLFSSREELRQMPGKVLTSLLVPAIASVETAQTRTQAYEPLLHAAFLVQRHLAGDGELPLSLAEVPGADAAGLADPFAEGSVQMLIDGRGLVLYSVGPNGVDNGGKRQDEGDGCDDLRVILPVPAP